MRDVIYQQLDRFATLPVFITLLVLFGLCLLGFRWRAKALNERAGGKEIVTFDGRYAYTPKEAHDLLEMMGERGRRFYALTEMTLDLVFPFIYGSLFLIAIYRLYGDPGYLLLVPVIGSVADWLENFTNTYLALSHQKGSEPFLARFSSICTGVKRSGFTISFILVCVGIAVWFWHRRRTAS
jgi:hypothetical protein